MRLLPMLALLLPACSFDGATTHGNSGDGDGGGDTDAGDAATLPDAGIPDAVAMCTANEPLCTGDILTRCNANGTGIDPGANVVCDFACVEDDHCIDSSNLVGAQTDLCDAPGASIALTPDVGATVNIIDNGTTLEIQCAPHCGDLVTTSIPAQALLTSTSPGIAMFCLSVLLLPNGTTINAAPNLSQAVALVVQSSVSIAGDINFSGRTPGTFDVGIRGASGPGGSQGGIQHFGTGVENGQGNCAGAGGESENGGETDDQHGGGGGGGGHLGQGGDGGEAQTGNNGNTPNGGIGGGSSACGQDNLVPLSGGSGGGSGGTGVNFFGNVGFAGGGGGGALQISARLSIDVSGNIIANGGAGVSPTTGSEKCGGGGGGAGGAVLLEAPIVTVSGAIRVNGGNGGNAGAGNGGPGANGVSSDGANGASQGGSNESGAGGGGGGGRVRLNATPMPTCQNVSPTASCTTGTMPAP